MEARVGVKRKRERKDRRLYIKDSTFEKWEALKIRRGFKDQTNDHFLLVLIEEIENVVDDEETVTIENSYMTGDSDSQFSGNETLPATCQENP